jgi:very-short-patch-repair endonuclease
MNLVRKKSYRLIPFAHDNVWESYNMRKSFQMQPQQDGSNRITNLTWVYNLGNTFFLLKKKYEFFSSIQSLPRRSQIRKFYEFHHNKIIESSKKNCLGINPYELDWNQDWKKSPPEHSMWCSIRCAGLPFYPQYPVLEYFLDFGDPYRKIGIEIDGKNFHDIERDRARDMHLSEHGWRIFRIPATATQSRIVEPQLEDNFFHMREHERIYNMERWLQWNAEGILRAIEIFYYRDLTPGHHALRNGLEEENGDTFVNLCEKTLMRHKLANFSLYKDCNKRLFQ